MAVLSQKQQTLQKNRMIRLQGFFSILLPGIA